MVVEIGTQVCDDAMGQPVAMHELIQEVEYSVSLCSGDRLDFDPHGELIDGRQDSVESSLVSMKVTSRTTEPSGLAALPRTMP
jgi:hypothetical protein